MGKVLSVIKNPLRNFNLESRAFKVVSKSKPDPAPKHKCDQAEYERIMQSLPEIQRNKDSILDKKLRDIYVNSQESPMINLRRDDPERPLPLNREPVEDYELGFKEPLRVAFGKTSLRKALRFISEHQSDVKTHSVVKIAEDYVLPEEKVKHILKYFRVFEVYFPDKPTKTNFVGPNIPKTNVTIHTPKQIV